MGNPELLKDIQAAPSELGPPPEFYTYFWLIAAILMAILLAYYWTMEAEQFEVLRLLISSVTPLGILTVVMLAVVLFGITTATLRWPGPQLKRRAYSTSALSSPVFCLEQVWPPFSVKIGSVQA